MYHVQCIWKVFRPLHFFHVLLRYRHILKWILQKKFSLKMDFNNLHTIPYKKNGFLEIPYLHTLSYETRNWAQVHPVSIDHPWDVSTTWSPPVVNSIDWTWFGKAHTCLYKVTLNCGTLYRQVCLSKSCPINLIYHKWTPSCRNISRAINGNRMHLSSISSDIAKGLNTCENKEFVLKLLKVVIPLTGSKWQDSY